MTKLDHSPSAPPAPAVVPPDPAEGASTATRPWAQRQARRLMPGLQALALPMLGVTVLVGLWAAVAARTPALPGPAAGLDALQVLLSDPFRDGGPNDKGVGLQLAFSLRHVFSGFLLAALIGIPLGLAIGASRLVWRAVNPVMQVLRPVSPLAWFPIGLVVLQDVAEAATFVIFVTALWPTVLNTAEGAASVPADQRNVARVYRFSRSAYLRHILVPHSLPSIITGLRLSVGIAWMVIVAVEMLSGGVGIGFFVWDAYNAGDLAAVTAAIGLIGFVGFAMDATFLRLGRQVAGNWDAA